MIGGSPASGNYDLIFTLFDAATGGNQIGSPITVFTQTLSIGTFTVPLDFGPSAFQGDARWLQIAVRPSGSPTYTILAPRQALTPAPYAMSLVPGAVINGNTSGSGSTLKVTNSNGNAFIATGTADGVFGQGAAGVYGYSNTSGGNGLIGHAEGAGSGNVGVFGFANSGKGVFGSVLTGYGVYGETGGTDGTGIYGRANNGVNAAGVSGSSTSGNGVVGTGNNSGVLGTTTRAGGTGVTGRSDVSGGTNIGVAGITSAGNSSSKGVYGFAGPGFGVVGETTQGIGVLGVNSSGNNTAVYGEGNANGTGVYGSSSNSIGVQGTSYNGPGVKGTSTFGMGLVGVSGDGMGGVFTSTNSTGVQATGGYYGVFGNGPGVGVAGVSSTANGVGVNGFDSSSGATGVFGRADNGTGVHGVALTAAGVGVFGSTSHGTGVVGTSGDGTAGVFTSTSGVGMSINAAYGEVVNSSIVGVSASADDGSGNGTGVSAGGGATGVSATGGTYGVNATGGTYGVYSSMTTGTAAIYGRARNAGGYFVGDANYGVYASGQGYGVYATSPGVGIRASGAGWAGYFAGNVYVSGSCIGCLGTYQIDDPLDPANKYLSEAGVASSKMLDLYTGHVTLDANGEAWVDMPAWFQSLNEDFDYQLTCVGGYAPVYVAQEIENNRFKIAGGKPGMKVSWQVTGVRHDPYALQHPITAEQEKTGGEKGKYLYPTAYGQPESAGINYQSTQATEPQQPPQQQQATAPKP